MMNGADADRLSGNGFPTAANGRTRLGAADPRRSLSSGPLQAGPGAAYGPGQTPQAGDPDAPGAGDPFAFGDAGAGETCEIDYEGRCYTVPAALKDAFLRQQDYTKKTQDVARQRRMLERARGALMSDLAAQQQHVRDIAALVYLDEELQQMKRLDWPLLRQRNPQGAAMAAQRAMQFGKARDLVAAKLGEKLRARAMLARETEAKRAASAQEELRRDIKGWNADMARRLRDYGLSLGFAPEELAAVTDPRAIKALHRAWLGDQRSRIPSAPPPPADELRPLSQVARRSSPAEIELSDNMSTEDWIRARNRQVRQRKGY